MQHQQQRPRITEGAPHGNSHRGVAGARNGGKSAALHQTAAANSVSTVVFVTILRARMFAFMTCYMYY